MYLAVELLVTLAGGSRRDRVFTAAYLSVYMYDVSKTDTNLTHKCSTMSPGYPFIFGSEGKRLRSVTKTVPAWIFALL